VSLPLSWLSVSSINSAYCNQWSLTSLIVLAAASTLAGPIPANSLYKRDVVGDDILVREPEARDSELKVLAREPEVVEARDPSPGGCFHGGYPPTICI